MMLWKKDDINSSDGNAYYIDLLPPDENYRFWAESLERFKFAWGNIRKNVVISIDLRKNGNELYRAKNWTEAINQYNASIRYAIIGSENLALCYANRSACFLELKMYKKCLVDIALAREANYPQKLMHKLNVREAHCLELMKKMPENKHVQMPQLSFPPSEKFPGLANILDDQTNDEFGKHIVATCDIDVGKVIMVEDVYAFGADFKCEGVCKTCTKRDMNFIPCPHCADIMFCSGKCMESNNMHKLYCGALYNRHHRAMLTVETILVAVNAIPNVELLMKFVEKALATRGFDSPECESNDQKKYRLFLKLFAQPIGLNAVRMDIFAAFKLLMEIPIMKKMFDSIKIKRFLMHLIWHHICILRTNCFGIRHPKVQSDLVTSIRIHASLFNHSCVPNVLHVSHGNVMIGFVLRPVKKGEQLFIHYDRDVDIVDLQHTCNFQCKCTKCVPCWKLKDRRRIQSDVDFLFFKSVHVSEFDDHKKRLYFMKRFQKFFTNYGRLPWSHEIARLEFGYLICYMKELEAADE